MITASSRRAIDLTQALLPVREFALCLVILDSICFLDPADELVLGEIAPSLHDISLELIPVAFYAIPVHFIFISKGD